MAGASHAHGSDEEHESRYREGDAAAWDRPLRDTELYDPARRDVYNFIDETKVRYLRPLLPPSGSALEVGAGSGRLLIRRGRERPYRLVAVDYAPYAVRAVQENLRRSAQPGVALFGDALALPFADSSFDVVLSGGLLEHFREPEAVIGEMTRVLRPGGLFYADIVPRRPSLYRWSGRGLRRRRSEWLREVHPAQAHRRHREANDRHARGQRARLRAPGDRGGLPPGFHRPRERVPERVAPRAVTQGDAAAAAGDRGVRGHRPVLRRAGEDVLERHVHAARLRGR